MGLLLRREFDDRCKEKIARLSFVLIWLFTYFSISGARAASDESPRHSHAIDVIKREAATEEELLSAFRELNGTAATESRQFWIDIANNKDYPNFHRKLCMLAFFIRGLENQSLASELNAEESSWFEVNSLQDATDFTEIPVKRVIDNSVFVFRHPLLGATVVYFRVSKSIGISELIEIVHNKRGNNELKVLEIGVDGFDNSSSKLAGKIIEIKGCK